MANGVVQKKPEEKPEVDPQVKENSRIANLIEKATGMKFSEINQLSVEKLRDLANKFRTPGTFPSMSDEDKKKAAVFLIGNFLSSSYQGSKAIDGLHEYFSSIAVNLFGTAGDSDVIFAIQDDKIKEFINEKTKKVADRFGDEKNAREFLTTYMDIVKTMRRIEDNIGALEGYGPRKNPSLFGEASQLVRLLAQSKVVYSFRNAPDIVLTLINAIKGEGLNAAAITSQNNDNLSTALGLAKTAEEVAENSTMNGESSVVLVDALAKEIEIGGAKAGIAFLNANGYGQLWEKHYANAKNYVESAIASYYVNSVINKVDVAELSLGGRREEIGLVDKRTDSQRSKLVADSDERRQPKGEIKSEAPEDALKLAKKPRNIAEEDESENA